MKRTLLFAAMMVAGFGLSQAAAADKIRVVSSSKGFWDTTLFEFGREKGIFASEGLELDVVFAQGGGSDVLQTVIAGGADVGVGTGTAGALAAVTKGAPLVVVGSEFTGSSDIFFYSKATSSIESFKDLDGRRIGIPHPGASAETVATLLAEANGVNVEMLVTGGPPATITQVMTGQVDAGWSVYPIGSDRIAAGELRFIASANDAPGVSDQATRVIVAGKDYASKNEEVLKRFFQAYVKVLDWAYSTDEALQKYADIQKITLEEAREVVKTGYPREAVEWNRVGSLDLTIKAAIQNKVLSAPLSPEEIADIFKLVTTLH